jgi:dipeptidyl aminopeptidase/acylaminoacyl peptidase
VDAARLAIVGFSLGGRAALVATARDERVAAVVSIAGISDFTGPGLGEEFYAESATVLNGVSGQDIGQQWASLAGVEQPTDAVARLKIPLLVVHGWEDEVVPVFHADQLVMHAGPDCAASKALVDDADHVFSAHRGEVVGEVLGWLAAV